MLSSDSEHEPRVFREVVFEVEYEEARARICGGSREADDFLEGLEVFLSKRAEFGMVHRSDDPPGIATYVSKQLPSGERIRVLYGYSEKRVTLMDAWMIPGSFPQFFA